MFHVMDLIHQDLLMEDSLEFRSFHSLFKMLRDYSLHIFIPGLWHILFGGKR